MLPSAFQALASAIHRRLARRARAAAALEFGLTVPILGVALMGIADYANAIQHMTRLESAARSGAQIVWAQPATNATASATDKSAANAARNPDGEAAVRAFLTGWQEDTSADCETATTGAAVCIRAWTWCQCSGDAVDRANALRCTATCPGTETIRQYGSVTASRPFSPIVTAPVTRVVGNVELRIR
ncbi:pilus assembly protein [Roseomonas sp. PWR1]|uniref:Pilus assembly protein n=1 Tax=Roseomonas nitratireducens TaxID=2820810 RepID=A0ABS4AWB9_9PROT|nr:TadE family protein [Neoroseomonas nitratireducens]MBP0465665.1 pilus assembly protein [Neoroseomonas nitratireducens]